MWVSVARRGESVVVWYADEPSGDAVGGMVERVYRVRDVVVPPLCSGMPCVYDVSVTGRGSLSVYIIRTARFNIEEYYREKSRATTAKMAAEIKEHIEEAQKLIAEHVEEIAKALEKINKIDPQLRVGLENIAGPRGHGNIEWRK